MLRTDNQLLHVIRELSFARELGRVTEVIRIAARRLTRADGVTVVLKENDQCFYADEDALAPLWKGRRFPLSACVSGWVMTHGSPAVIKDIYADDRVPHDAYRPTFVRSLAMVPVRTSDPVAAIGAYWATEHEATAEEMEILETLAESASLALTNVQLWAENEASAERERTLRIRAEQLGALKDQFLATVSHELRTPLNVIQGWVWQLRQPHVPKDVMDKAVNALERNTQLQTRLVEDLLDASRATAGTLRVDSQLVDLQSICEAVLDVAQPDAHEKGVALTLGARPSEDARVYGDTERLHQIVWNLVANAIKFTPPDGRITVDVGRSETRAWITVADTGIGITAEFLPFVFDRFRQADPSSTRAYGGLGIGLHIVEQLVRLHDGAVRAESAGQHQGATLTVEFPLARPPYDGVRRRIGTVQDESGDHLPVAVESRSARYAADDPTTN